MNMLPQLGDDPETLRQKEQMRETAMDKADAAYLFREEGVVPDDPAFHAELLDEKIKKLEEEIAAGSK